MCKDLPHFMELVRAVKSGEYKENNGKGAAAGTPKTTRPEPPKGEQEGEK